MKVLFSHDLPFFLAHGGSQTLIEELMRGLKNRGVEVEPERWWDENQTGQILHYVGRPHRENIRLARKKGFKIVLTDLLDVVAARPKSKLFIQRNVIRAVERFAPGMTERVAWDVYRNADALIFALKHEQEVAEYLFGAPPAKCHVIPWGMQNQALRELAQPAPEGDFLVSLATIAPRKNTLALARAAREAQTPVVFAGKPYSEKDAYFREFTSLVDNKFVRYAGFVTEQQKYELLKQAKGFALLSSAESGCVAVYEAAAAGLPLFLTNAQWARSGYPGADPVRFVDPHSGAKLVNELRQFYSQAHRTNRHTFPLNSWDQIADKYVAIYNTLLANPA